MGVPACTTSPGSAVRVAMVPSNGATTIRSARFSFASSSCSRIRCASSRWVAICDCCWAICCESRPTRLREFRDWPGWLSHVERTFRGIDFALRGRDGGFLRERGRSTPARPDAGSRRHLSRVLYKRRGQRRQSSWSLAAARVAPERRRDRPRPDGHGLRIDLRLLQLQIVLAQLFFEDGDLLLRESDARIGFGDGGTRLIFAGLVWISSRVAMTSPALTVSPSRKRISAMRPATLGAMAESSPSMRPLSWTTPAGTGAGCRNSFQTP